MTPYYEHGGITIYHGDCREIVRGLERRWDAVVTDPPYGIGKEASIRRPTNYQRMKGMRPREWDYEAPDLSHVLRTAGQIILWGGNYFADQVPPSRGWLFWFKPDAPPSMSNIEMAWTSMNRNAAVFSHSIAATNAERVGHPTQKPLAVMTWCVGLLPCLGPFEKRPVIMDPYMGSGTTLRAAKNLNCEAIGIEIEERYCEIAAQRLSQEVLAL